MLYRSSCPPPRAKYSAAYLRNLRSIIKPFPNIPFSVHLLFQTENIPHSHPGFLPDAPTALKSYDISTSFCNLRLFAELCSIQYLSIRIHEYFCMLIRLFIYYIFYPYFKFYRRTCVVPFTPQTRSRASSSHPLPAISLLNFLKIPSSASSSSGSPYSTL